MENTLKFFYYVGVLLEDVIINAKYESEHSKKMCSEMLFWPWHKIKWRKFQIYDFEVNY